MSRKSELNLLGVVLPICLLKCKNALGKLDSDEELEVLMEDPGAVEDLLKIIRRSQDQVMKVTREGEHFRIRIKRA